jgi:hypothetical protein
MPTPFHTWLSTPRASTSSLRERGFEPRRDLTRLAAASTLRGSRPRRAFVQEARLASFTPAVRSG